jgi:hypothetical protein
LFWPPNRPHEPGEIGTRPWRPFKISGGTKGG